VVIITPDDNLLINGGSEERRRFMDNLLSQLDHVYLQNLQLYLKVLEQRNAFLKRLADNPTIDSSLLAAYDEQLSPPGAYIYQQRRKMAEELAPVFTEIYSALSEDHEKVKIIYESGMHERPLIELLQADRHRDMILKRTNSGIHKDDLDFDMDEHGVKRFGSQGQQKSFLVALKLAQYRLLKEHKGLNPLLLLDDIFDKLDATRSANLLQYIMSHGFGQIFITDTQRERVERVFEGNEEVAFVEVVEGSVR
jgi:DNA replication and repair protein RecF